MQPNSRPPVKPRCGSACSQARSPDSTTARLSSGKPRWATGDRLSHTPRPALWPGPRNRSTLQGPSKGACGDQGEVAGSGQLGQPEAVRHRRGAPQQLPGALERLQGEPRPGPLCLAHPHPGDLRRLCPGHQGHARLDHPAGSSLQRPPAAAAIEHHAGAGHRPAHRRRAAGGPAQRRAARPRPPPLPDGAPPGRAGLHPDRLGRRPGPDRRADPGQHPRTAGRLPDQPGHPQRDLLRRAEGRAGDGDQLGRQRRPGLPLAEHLWAQGRARRGRHDVFVQRLDRQRPDRVRRR